MQSVNALVVGLKQVDDEVIKLGQLRSLPSNDQFIHAMRVRQASLLHKHTVADLLVSTDVFRGRCGQRGCAQEDGHLARDGAAVPPRVLWRDAQRPRGPQARSLLWAHIRVFVVLAGPNHLAIIVGCVC